MNEEKLIVEYNKDFRRERDEIPISKHTRILLTPPLNKDYWLFRVKLYKDQAILAFPKMGTIGIGFAIEDNWNTNLPYEASSESLYEHIKHNKKYSEIPKDLCIRAISMIQEKCRMYEKGEI